MMKPTVQVPQFVDIYLYILMRSDLASMNPGKACAQATHAANQCVYEIRQSNDVWLMTVLGAWENVRGFGTCIVLDVGNGIDLVRTVTQATEHGFHAGITHDPSYPLLDGSFIHHIPLDTCGYVFGRKHLLEPFLKKFPLMR